MSFRQKLHFWVTCSERYLIKVVHMDRTNHQILDFWGKPTFPDFCKNEFILLGWILKPSSMLGATPQGLFVSRKYTFLDFWDMPDLQKAPFLTLFAVFVSEQACGHQKTRL